MGHVHGTVQISSLLYDVDCMGLTETSGVLRVGCTCIAGAHKIVEVAFFHFSIVLRLC